jgi:hypothetical protein
MKKVLQILAAVVVSVGLMGNVANADACSGDIVVHNSGSGNNTTISCENIENVTITCVNNVTVANISYQEGQSGPATVGGNESDGSSTTGSVTNENNQTTQVGVTGCGAEVPATPTTPTPTTPATPTTAAPKQKVAVLPYTASSSVAETALIAVAVAAVVAIASRIAVVAYRRVSLK